jgi:hypothetical protein
MEQAVKHGRYAAVVRLVCSLRKETLRQTSQGAQRLTLHREARNAKLVCAGPGVSPHELKPAGAGGG